MNLAQRALLACIALGLSGGAAFGQQPTQAQTNAIRQSCRSDYQANCSGVPTGGRPALNCLQSHMADLSPGCQAAVSAVGGGTSAETPAPSRPPAQGGAAGPRREEARALRTACRSDFRAYCRGVELGGGRALGCLQENAARLSPACKGALSQISGG